MFWTWIGDLEAECVLVLELDGVGADRRIGDETQLLDARPDLLVGQEDLGKLLPPNCFVDMGNVEVELATDGLVIALNDVHTSVVP